MLPDLRLILAALFTTVLFVGVSFSILAALRSAQTKSLPGVGSERATLSDNGFASLSPPRFRGDVEDGRELTSIIAEVALKEHSTTAPLPEPMRAVLIAPDSAGARTPIIAEAKPDLEQTEFGDITGSVRPVEPVAKIAVPETEVRSRPVRRAGVARRGKKRVVRRVRRPTPALQQFAPLNPLAAIFGGLAGRPRQ